MNQSDVAERLNMSVRAYRDMENSPKLMTFEIASELAKIFEISLLELLCLEIRQILKNNTIGSVNGSSTSYINDADMIRRLYESLLKEKDHRIALLERQKVE